MTERYHVYPTNDLVEHDTDSFDECVCGPGVQYIEGGTLVVHNSLDGREHDEDDHDRVDCPLCSSHG